MGIPGLTGSELMAWVDYTSTKWQALFKAHPDALQLPCDIRETSNVGELVQHIVAVELRYAERLAGLPETLYADVPAAPAEAIYLVHDKAMSLLEQLQDRDEAWWDVWLQFSTRSGGTMRAPRRTILVHLLMHSIRHYSQLATLTRQHGIASDWWMDYLGMTPKEPPPPSQVIPG